MDGGCRFTPIHETEIPDDWGNCLNSLNLVQIYKNLTVPSCYPALITGMIFCFSFFAWYPIETWHHWVWQGNLKRKTQDILEKSKLPMGACMRHVFQNALLFVEGRFSLITCPLQIHARFCFMVMRGRSLNFAIVKLKKFLGAALFLLWNGKTITERQKQKRSVSVVEKNARVMCVLFSLL